MSAALSAPGASTRTATGHAPTAGEPISCRPAASAEEIAAHHAIRHRVFVTEQEVFAGSDRDAHDDAPDVIRLLGRYGDTPAGAVRLFRLDEDNGLWQGDRLCVLATYRVHGLGAPLVRCAVATAGARGGACMIAHIQLPNVAFFTHLGWHAEGGTEIYAGLAHQPMVIDLPSPAAGPHTERQLSTGIQR